MIRLVTHHIVTLEIYRQQVALGAISEEYPTKISANSSHCTC